jgi:type VI secretion system secreted protein Hcp
MKRLVMIAAGILAVVAIGGAGFAFAATGGSDSTISACVKNSNGAVRLVASGTACKTTEHAASWNTQGPAGPAGATGPAGPSGSAASVPCPATTPAVGTSNLFLKVDGILGSSSDDRHKNEIDVTSYALGAGGAATSCPGSATPGFADLQVTKLVDKSSPLLYGAAMSRTPIASMVLTVRKPGTNPIEYLTLTFANVTVAGVRPVASSTGLPTETVSFSYTKLTQSYKPQKPDGTLDTAVTSCFDLATGAC